MAEPDNLAGFFRGIRQGHAFKFGGGAEAGRQQLVVVSQTCDVVLPKRPTVSLARVVELDGPDRTEAASGASPRLVALPALSNRHFADLCFIDSRSKDDLAGQEFVEGIDLSDDQARRRFSLALARWFGRFPFPDEVVPWLRPLETIVRQKYRRQSKLGQLLREVIVEIRVEESSQWRQPPYDLTVHTIVRAEALPSLPDDRPGAMDDFVKALRETDDRVKPPGALAELFFGTNDARRRHQILGAVAESFAATCKPTAKDATITGVSAAVSSIEGQLWGDDEFPISRFYKTEALDLEFLSESG